MEKYLEMEYTAPIVKKTPIGQSSSFTECEVWTNIYRVEMPSRKWYLWDLDFWPKLEKDSREMKIEIIEKNQKSIRETLEGYIHTGNTIYTLQLPKNRGSAVFFKDHPKYKVILRFTDRQVTVEELLQQDQNVVKPMLQLMNSSVKQKLRTQNFTQMGKRNQLFFQEKNKLSSEVMAEMFIEQIVGIGCPINLYQGSIPKMLIHDGSRIRRTRTMLEEYKFFKKEFQMNHDEILDEYIVGKQFMKNYGNQETLVIQGEDPTGRNPLSPFPNLDKAKTFNEYYKKQYGLKINDLGQFLVYAIKRRVEFRDGERVVTEEKEFLLPELLRPIGLTSAMRSNKFLMKEITQNGQMKPNQRIKQAESHRKLINNCDKEINPLGLEIISNSNKVKAKLLPFPIIQMRTKFDLYDLPSSNFALKQPIYEKGARITDWLVISSEIDAILVDDMLKALKEAGQTLGIEVCPPFKRFISKSTKGRVSASDILKVIESEKERPRIVLMMFPKSTADTVYKQVKCECIKNLGILTQFFSNFSYRDHKSIRNLSVASKLVAQMAAKLGNRLWLVNIPASIQQREKRLVVVGADVFHKSLHSSITSVVGTIDKELSRYYSQTGIQKRRGDDCLHDISDKVVNVARQYVEKNNCPATTIVVFRDGVGESQLNQVRVVEVASLLKGLRTEFGDRVELLYVVVVKRVEAKFFVEREKGQFENPENIVVDEGVIRQNEEGIYMVSQEARNGSVIPTYYEILHNSTDLSADEMYKLINCLCFNYPNWSGPLKIPAVVQMANQQGTIVGMFNAKEGELVHDKLKNTLFYL
jgi:aubergine-like protein